MYLKDIGKLSGGIRLRDGRFYVDAIFLSRGLGKRNSPHFMVLWNITKELVISSTKFG